jgi:hypothetical protein
MRVPRRLVRTVADAPAGLEVGRAVFRLLGWGEGIVGLLKRGSGPRGNVGFMKAWVDGHDLLSGSEVG